MEENKKIKSAFSWPVYIGCMLIGTAIGILYGNPGVGILIGMGVGFISAAIIRNVKRR